MMRTQRKSLCLAAFSFAALLAVIAVTRPKPQTHRVFGPPSRLAPSAVHTFSPSEQRIFLERHQRRCSLPHHDVLLRYESLSEAWAHELFKYCALRTGVFNLYWDASQTRSLVEQDWPSVSTIWRRGDDDAVPAFLFDTEGTTAETMLTYLLTTSRPNPLDLNRKLALLTKEWNALDVSCREPCDRGYCCQVWEQGKPTWALERPQLGDDAPTTTTSVHVDYQRVDHGALLPSLTDLLRENDAIPDSECRRCLEAGGTCASLCQPYLRILCQIRPPRKPVTEVWNVSTPTIRHIPHVVHQVQASNRVVESFRQSGWEHRSYSDMERSDFLREHFPASLMDAYDASSPGVQLDLFRYGVLLIHGGLFADASVLLESHLDTVVEGTEFVASDDGNDGLWNGFVAATPAHPYIAKALENRVNHIRNRWQLLDFQDWFCPSPAYHKGVNGATLLATSVNQVSGRHLQASGDWPMARILESKPNDMGARRMTWTHRNLVVAATDLPEYDAIEAPPETLLYIDDHRANEDVKIMVSSPNHKAISE